MHGKTITLPANWHNSNDPTKDKHAMHGLILASQTQDVQTQSIPDGQTLTASSTPVTSAATGSRRPTSPSPSPSPAPPSTPPSREKRRQRR